MAIIRPLDYQVKIIALWTVFLLGTLFHTQLALMPIFHGIDVAIMRHDRAAATIAEIEPILRGMLLFFALPMVAIVGTAFCQFRRFRTLHFGLTAIYTVLNLTHLVGDLSVVPIVWYQIVLMLLLLVVGILLNIVSYQWLKCDRRHFKALPN